MKGKFDVCVISLEGRKFCLCVEFQRYFLLFLNEGIGFLLIENFDFKVLSFFVDLYESFVYIVFELCEFGEISKEEELN